MCVAVGVLWARSYWAHDYVTLSTSTGDFGTFLGNFRGDIGVDTAGTFSPLADWEIGDNTGTLTPRLLEEEWYDFTLDPGHRLLGVRWKHFMVGASPMWQFGISHGLLAALTAVMPIWWLLRSRGPAPGHCKACGYDLRGSPEACPECGTTRNRI